MTDALETLSEQRCFEGVQGFYRHASAATGGPMRFCVFVPERAARSPCPALYYLAGLECTEQTFVIKAGAQRVAAALGLALVTCDTSPRPRAIPATTPTGTSARAPASTSTPPRGHLCREAPSPIAWTRT